MLCRLRSTVSLAGQTQAALSSISLQWRRSKLQLTYDQSKVCYDSFLTYFGKFKNIEDYMREQKLNSLSERSISLPDFGLDKNLFDDFSIHPKEMEFEIVEMDQSIWDLYLNMISSHSNMTSIPGRCLRLAVLEKKSNKWVGFIRLGSPVINMKPRNELLKGVFSQDKTFASSFNKSTIMGFVIVPAQPFGYNYLGGKLLAAICCSHWVREKLNAKYNMNTCLFETTSLYGSTKQVSQYDGMKPYIRFKGVTDSNFIPMMHGEPYNNLKKYVEDIVGVFVPEGASSRKMKIINKIISMTKAGLKNTPEYNTFKKLIEDATSLTEQKRYYISNYGISNFVDIVRGETNQIIKDKDNYDKFELNNIIEWWRKKAEKRYETLNNEGKVRKEIEVWTSNKNIDIIR
jgi:hypothetical protein